MGIMQWFNDFSESICKKSFCKFRDGDLHVRNVERGSAPKTFEDSEMEALLGKDDGQTQQLFAEQLNADQQTVIQTFKRHRKDI